ncbi:MAG: pyridoxamine kinase [Treponemataceae bacterium]|nr:pyridoxamine kinase [Treponemataceae bacterium]
MQRLLTIQDISCVGQCSLTVALPVISACGIETAVLPSSVLSNHTAFKSWSFNDLTGGMDEILEQWKAQNIDFSAFYTGYVSAEQIPVIKKIIAQCARKDALVIVDPVMADNGKLYAGFGEDFPAKMAELCNGADVILPNITEACLLLGEKYPGSSYDKPFIENMCKNLLKLGAKAVCLTGVSFNDKELGCCIYDGEKFEYYFAQKIDVSMHGTGDVFASCFAGCLCRGKNMRQAAQIAADFVVDSILKTVDDPSHWYGVNFEKALPGLIKALEK